MKKRILISLVLLIALAATAYIGISSTVLDKQSYRKLAWETVKHDKTITDWKEAPVSFADFDKSGAGSLNFGEKANRFLLFLNGGRAVKVELSTTQDGMLGPVVLYFNPFTKQCAGEALRQ